MIWLWLTGLLRRRPARLVAVTAGAAITVAMLASLGSFLSQSQATMTDRAVRNVAVDWQIQLMSGADPAAVQNLVDNSPQIRTAPQVASTDRANSTFFGINEDPRDPDSFLNFGGTSAAVRVDNCRVTGNGNGVIASGGQLLTRGNNTLEHNTNGNSAASFTGTYSAK